MLDRRGKFELADGGTLFLDEIGDMSLKTQAKVLRALQEQVVEPVGGASSVRVDVRVLAATNKDLTAEIRAARFREDLYFRLNVIPIFVPPLRDRADDVPRLAEHFMAEFAREYGRRRKTLDAGGARLLLQRYRWPGNVRELRNVIERLMIMVPGDTIAATDLAFLDGAVADRRHRRRAVDRSAARGARCVASATTSCARSRRSRATSRARPTRSASSAATSIARCAGFGIAPTRQVDEEERGVELRTGELRRSTHLLAERFSST